MAAKSTDMLTKAATEFAGAKAQDLISNLGSKAGGTAPKKEEQDGEENKGFAGTIGQKLGEGASPVKAAFSGMGSAVKGLFQRKGGSKRPTNIYEERLVGVPQDVCFAAWTQFEEFPSFMKGPENVSRGEEKPEEELEEGEHPLEGEETNWTAKVFINRRQWKATTVDYDPPKRLSWTTEGAKGTIDGTVTFTAIGENATLIVMTLEYRPKGFIEWVGNRWRAVPRRARLDLSHFGRYVMRTEPDELPDPEESEDTGDIDETNGEEPEDVIDETGEGDQEPQEDAEGDEEESTDTESTDEPEEPEEDDSEDSGEPEPATASSRPRRKRG